MSKPSAGALRVARMVGSLYCPQLSPAGGDDLARRIDDLTKLPELLEAGEMLERAGSLTCSCPDDTWFTCGGCLMRRAIQKATGENDV